MKIAQYQLTSPVVLAPMAGITDQPFRQICSKMGAGLTVSEMLSSNPKVWQTNKSKNRMQHTQDMGINVVQIAGSDPDEMAQAAQINVGNGAQIIDINMGCPAKKVNKKLAGSALLKEPALVEAIIKKVVSAVAVPVTLKIRTGWCENTRNGIEIANIAQHNGIQSLAVHGRTRNDFYKGHAEYDTIKAIKQNISIPVVANGDITSPQKAEQVLHYTGADAIMIGRGAQGNPWIFQHINQFLAGKSAIEAATVQQIRAVVFDHINALHQFYGDYMGVRYARKHIAWYVQKHIHGKQFRTQFNALESCAEQLAALNDYFDNLTLEESDPYV